MYLQPLDFVVIAAYLLGLFLLGVVFSGGQTSREVYFLGGRRVPWLLAGISVVATLLSTVSYLSLPGEMIRNGVGFFTSLFAFILIIPVVNRVVIPALMRLPVTSIYDHLEKRFGLPARTLGAVVFVIMRLIWMGLILYTASRAIGPMTGWPLPALIVVTGVVTVFYTTLGGMRAVIFSDFAQFVILFGGAVLIPVYVAIQTATMPWTWWDVFSQAERTSTPVMSFDPTVRTSMVGLMMMTFLWNICTHSSDQVAAQRYLSTTSAAAARRSFWVFSLANISLILLLMVGGLSLFYFHFHSGQLPVAQFHEMIAEKADDVLPQFIAQQLPAGLSGLLLAALLAAAMSSLSSGINSISAVFVNDLLPSAARGQAETAALGVPRLLAVVSGLIAIGLALLIEGLMRIQVDWNLVDLIERVNHLFVAPLGALFFAGIWFRRIGLASVLLGFLVGVTTSFLISFSEQIFGYAISFMWIMPGSFVASLAVAYTSSFWFGRSGSLPTERQLGSLYRGGRRGSD